MKILLVPFAALLEAIMLIIAWACFFMGIRMVTEFLIKMSKRLPNIEWYFQ